MTFDIYSLDECEDDWHEALQGYTDELIGLFVDSPEGLAHFEKYQDVGGWSAQFIQLGFVYQEVTLPEMDVSDVESILLNIFPRKISLISPDDINDTIPELIAFWKYLQREYDLLVAENILNFLQELDIAKLRFEMNNPANFGIAKSFLQSGIDAGFDMTNNEEAQAFQQLYNASLRTDSSLSLPLQDETVESSPRSSTRSKKSRGNQRRRQAIAKASRKRNRKKRK